MGTIPATNLGGYTEKIINENHIGIAKKDIKTEILLDEILKLSKQSHQLNYMQNNAINFRNDNFIWENNIKYLNQFLKEGDIFD